MNVKTKIAALLAAAAMLTVPAAALAGGPDYAPQKPPQPTHPAHPADPTPGPKASMPEKAAAYGVKCREESKKHVKGEKGTAFSRCVTAMAKAANGQSAKVACKAESKKHVKGEKGTAFSRCVHKANEVRKEAKANAG
jgi:hypothetical protein